MLTPNDLFYIFLPFLMLAMCPEKTSNTNGIQLSWPATFAGETAQSNERCPVNTQNRKLS